MYADALLDFERAHLLRLLVWGGACAALGSTLLVWLAAVRRRSPLLYHFALQTATWGIVDLAIAGWGSRGLALRDYAGAMRLERFLWLNVGLDVGYAMVGVTLVACGWAMGRRLGPIGAGLAVIVQGMALALLDLVLAGQIAR